MAGIHIDWEELEQAFENHDPLILYVLDRRTGAVAATKDVISDPNIIRVEPLPSREQYRMMERFIESVTSAKVREALNGTIVGRGAFRRFKDVLVRFPEERRRWFAFRDSLVHRHILDWLKLHKLELVEMPAWNLDLPPSLPPSVEPDTEVQHTAEVVFPVSTALESDVVRAFVLGWAHDHGEEHRHFFGPVALAQLAEALSAHFAISKRP
jgi:Uncharacterised protein family (UPF0158)